VLEVGEGARGLLAAPLHPLLALPHHLPRGALLRVQLGRMRVAGWRAGGLAVAGWLAVVCGLDPCASKMLARAR